MDGNSWILAIFVTEEKEERKDFSPNSGSSVLKRSEILKL